MQILLIDDDTIDRLAVKRVLRDSNLTITCIDEAHTADEGFEKAIAKPYDLIILDYQLPPSNGIDVLVGLKESQGFSTSVVMLSHSNDEELALKCIEAGAQDFIMKGEISATRLRRAIIIAQERHALALQIQENHSQLKKLAEIDPLTGLNNRYFFDEQLKTMLNISSRTGNALALILIDLDKFKGINDRFGHVVGDCVLQQFSQRLKSSTRDSDLLFRIGGDEFAVIANNLGSEEKVVQLVQRILAAFEQPMVIDTQSIGVSVSIGIASCPECALESIELRKCADIALYRAKDRGRGQAQYYSKTFHALMEYRLRIERELKHAVAKGEFELHYQPQFNQSMELVGAEALIRWYHPKLGLLYPEAFIAIAEERGLIIPIGDWVIENAIRQLSVWKKHGYAGGSLTVAVNISPIQLADHHFSSRVQSMLKRYGVAAKSIEFEIVERCLISEGVAASTLNALGDLGIRVAIDDFGTGFSAISRLKDYPIDIVKIDKSFLKSIELGESQRLFRAICAFADSLGYETVVEGVETIEQHQICQSMQVTRVQGFKYSKPLTAAAFETQFTSLSQKLRIQ